tara:strand:+ start:1316 stop:1525 length:210 start_codon:yes stop_codon:yes gene_type:complete
MPGKHAYKKHCFKMKDKTGLMKIEKKKNANTSKPFDKHCFKRVKGGDGSDLPYKMFGMANPDPNANKGK